MKARKSKMCHYFGHFYLTIIVTSRTLARPMRSMKANQIAVSQVTATDGFRETGPDADSSIPDPKLLKHL